MGCHGSVIKKRKDARTAVFCDGSHCLPWGFFSTRLCQTYHNPPQQPDKLSSHGAHMKELNYSTIYNSVQKF